MVKVVWTTSALEDLDNIGEFIAKDSLKYAIISVE
jgi:plasmid stabilization system protein ParE